MTSRTTSRSRSAARRRLLVLVAAILFCAVAAAAVEFQLTATQAAAGFQAAQARLDADLAAARGAGYTDQQLAPVERGETSATTIADPIWVTDRPGYYEGRVSALDGLRLQLRSLEAASLQMDRADTSDTLRQAAAQVGEATALGADPQDLSQLHEDLAAAELADSSATRPRDYLAILARARTVLARAEQLNQAQEADLSAIQQAAATLQAQTGSDPAKLKQLAQLAIAAGRNDASTAAFMRLTALTRPYNQLERYDAVLQEAGTDPAKLALAAAGAQRYQQAIHSALLAAFPHQVIVVSYQAQELWAYENGKLVKDTLVTTGRPQLPTDIGAMKVLSKSSPWTMHSPWPRSSPWWYPDTKVQMVLWFTITGEGLHDAYWEYASQYGPGGQFGGAASHGCIHLPLAAETFLFNWAKVGTPVIVIPGDGSPVAAQVAQITVDANGNPTTGPKGV